MRMRQNPKPKGWSEGNRWGGNFKKIRIMISFTL